MRSTSSSRSNSPPADQWRGLDLADLYALNLQEADALQRRAQRSATPRYRSRRRGLPREMVARAHMASRIPPNAPGKMNLFPSKSSMRGSLPCATSYRCLIGVCSSEFAVMTVTSARKRAGIRRRIDCTREIARSMSTSCSTATPGSICASCCFNAGRSSARLANPGGNARRYSSFSTQDGTNSHATSAHVRTLSPMVTCAE